MNKKLFQFIPTVMLFGRSRNKSKNDSNDKKKKGNEGTSEIVDVKKYITDVSLTKLDGDYALIGQITTDKHFSKLALQVSAIEERGGMKYSMAVHFFKYEDVNPDVPVNFYVVFQDIFPDLKYIEFLFIDSYDGNLALDNFHTYHQIGFFQKDCDEL